MRVTDEAAFLALTQRDTKKQPITRPDEKNVSQAKPATKKGKIQTAVKMNKTEYRYGHLLEMRFFGGEIADWKFQPDKLILTESRPVLRAMTYTPDFRVIPLDPNEKIEYHEVKGFRREDWLVKWKVAIAMYPQYVFVLCEYKNGQWKITRY